MSATQVAIQEQAADYEEEATEPGDEEDTAGGMCTAFREMLIIVSLSWLISWICRQSEDEELGLDGLDILKGTGRRAVALYPYAAAKTDELTFSAGQVIDLISTPGV
jgi:hypothetical protein